MTHFCYTFTKCGRPTYTAEGAVGAGMGAGTRQAGARPAEAALGDLWAAGGSAQPPPGSGVRSEELLPEVTCYSTK